MAVSLLALCAFATLSSQSANALRPGADSYNTTVTYAHGSHILSEKVALVPHDLASAVEGLSVEEVAHALPMEVLSQALMLAFRQEGMVAAQLLEAGRFDPLDDAANAIDGISGATSQTIDGINELHKDITNAVEQGHLDLPTMGALILAVCLIIVWALIHQLWRTFLYMTWPEMWETWMKPLIMLPILTYVTHRLYEVAKGEDFDLFSFWGTRDNDVLRMLMLLSVMWWCVNFVLEVVLFNMKEFEDREEFRATDVYTDLTEPMFNVVIRFVVQCCLMLVLIFEAERNVIAGHPDEMALWRRWFNFGFALSLQFFLWVRQSRTWQDLFRLKSTLSVEFIDCQEKKQVIRFPPGEFYIRAAMSILTNGIFHKFLILSYPLFIFTNYGTSQGQALVRQALSITLVLSLDNLGGAKTFIAHKVDMDAGTEAESEGES